MTFPRVDEAPVGRAGVVARGAPVGGAAGAVARRREREDRGAGRDHVAQRRRAAAVAARAIVGAVRFSYYGSLTKAEQAWYRKSDAAKEVPIRDARALRPLLAPIEAALAADAKKDVEAATRALVDALMVRLDAPAVVVKVLAVRPADGDSELHGLYVAEEGKKPVLRVWMRTAAQRRPVAFRTFVRTVLHEVVHHLDFLREQWPYSFHTEGFFQRESHLARQLLGPSPRRVAAQRAPKKPARAKADQLRLL